jgi:amino acid transporter
MVSYVMFEATIINTVVTNWNYNESPAILISGKSISCPKVRSVLTLLPVTLLFFLAVNVYRADIFGEAECKENFTTLFL